MIQSTEKRRKENEQRHIIIKPLKNKGKTKSWKQRLQSNQLHTGDNSERTVPCHQTRERTSAERKNPGDQNFCVQQNQASETDSRCGVRLSGELLPSTQEAWA